MPCKMPNCEQEPRWKVTKDNSFGEVLGFVCAKHLNVFLIFFREQRGVKTFGVKAVTQGNRT